MVLRPSGSATLALEAPALPLSSRPKRSELEGPAVWRSLPGYVFRQCDLITRYCNFAAQTLLEGC